MNAIRERTFFGCQEEPAYLSPLPRATMLGKEREFMVVDLGGKLAPMQHRKIPIAPCYSTLME